MSYVCWMSFVLFELRFNLCSLLWVQSETSLKLNIVTTTNVQHEVSLKARAVNETIERITVEKIFAQSQKLADPVYLLLISAV